MVHFIIKLFKDAEKKGLFGISNRKSFQSLKKFQIQLGCRKVPQKGKYDSKILKKDSSLTETRTDFYLYLIASTIYSRKREEEIRFKLMNDDEPTLMIGSIEKVADSMAKRQKSLLYV